MATLTIFLLGTFRVTLDDRPVTGFVSDKVRALLAFLAVEPDRPHRREVLVGLLWPEYSKMSARANFRNALANLRQIIGDRTADDPFICITRQTIQINSQADVLVDVNDFRRHLEYAREGSQEELEAALNIYQGGFLEGFSLPDSLAFDEWSLLTREQLQRQALSVMVQIVDLYEQHGDYERAQKTAWQLVSLDPYREDSQCSMMRILALSGRRQAALTCYGTFRRLLADEMGIEPMEETTKLFEQILEGKLGPRTSLPQLEIHKEHLAFLDNAHEPEDFESPVFVAREREMAQLEQFLDCALKGEGRVVFITGGAGRGKTALLRAFAQRAIGAYEDLIIAFGHCNAYTGSGDPYLPFREILSSLTGDVNALWSERVITRDQAYRLWNTIPIAVEALVDYGPDLVDTIVNGQGLERRASVQAAMGGREDADWLTRLKAILDLKATVPPTPRLVQIALYEQYKQVILSIAQRQPLMLVLDDLQWVDSGSVDLLFHLGRSLKKGCILIVGAYRPEEVAMGRISSIREERQRHPLEPLVWELQRIFSDIFIDLGEVEERRFIDDFLDSEPNRLSAEFRELLFQQTGGHPLFTVELLRGMQERGDLIQDDDNRWVDGSVVDWDKLPLKVEAVIEERIAHLNTSFQETLRIASVEGEVFTAELVARVQSIDEVVMVKQLSQELDQRHRLVSASGVKHTNVAYLSRYKFRNLLYQKYLYSKIGPVERVYLHNAVGTELELMYGDKLHELEPIYIQLARHFQEAGRFEKAIDYLCRAGDRAVRMAAFEEAKIHYTQGLRILERSPSFPNRIHQEMALQMGLCGLSLTTEDSAAPEVDSMFDRLWQLCQQIGETPDHFQVLTLLARYYLWSGKLRSVSDVCVELSKLADRYKDAYLNALSNYILGIAEGYLGELTQAHNHIENVITTFALEYHHPLKFIYGIDPDISSRIFLATIFWLLGYPEQAIKRVQEATDLAQELAHPLTQADVYCWGCLFHTLQGNAQGIFEMGKKYAIDEISKENLTLATLASFCVGWSLVEEGQSEQGIAQMSQAIADHLTAGYITVRSQLLTTLAASYRKVGKIEDGLTALGDALAIANQNDERFFEPEIFRLMGELLITQGESNDVVESHYWRAIEIARLQNARMWELRATTSLYRFRQAQGTKEKREEARRMLEDVYAWFTEGFDEQDLIAAKVMLDRPILN